MEVSCGFSNFVEQLEISVIHLILGANGYKEYSAISCRET